MKTIINNIEVKVGKLIAKYDQLSAEKLDLQRNNNTLNVLLQEKETQIVALQDKVKWF